MANEDQIVSVIDVQKTQKQIDQTIEGLTKVVALIDKANQSVKGSSGASGLANAQKDQNKAMDEAAKLTKKLTELETQQSKENAVLKERIRQKTAAQKEEINSNAEIVGHYKAMSTQLEKMRRQYKDLAAAGQANTAEGKKMLKGVQDLDKNIKALDASVGQHQRNVGNYSSALSGLGGKFAAMPGPIGQVGSAIQKVGAVMLANPIILVITAITAALAALVSAFKRTDDGGTEMAARFEQLSAIFDVVMDRVGRLATGFSNILKGNFSEGFEQMTTSFSGISEQLQSAANAAYDYAYAMDAINDRITEFISEEAQLRNEIAKLMFTAKDQTKSDEERRIALSQALEKEKEIAEFKKTTANQIYDEEIKKQAAILGANEKLLKVLIQSGVKETQEMRKNSKVISDIRNRLGDDNAKKLEELYAKAINEDTAYFEGSKRAYAQMTGFEKSQADERAKINADLMKKKKEQEEAAAKESRKTQNEVTLEYMRAIRAIGGRGLGAGATTGTIDVGNNAPEQMQPIATGPNPESPSLDNYTEAELAADAAAWNQKIQIAADAVAKIDSIVNQSFQNRINALDMEAAKDEETKQRELEAAGNNATAIRAINDKYDAKEKEREKEKRRLQKEQAKYQKTSALISAIINTALGVTAALANPGGILGIVIAALAAATGIAQIALIASQPLPSYRKGRKGGPAEFANINEAGQEAIVTKQGETFFPSGPVAFIPAGADVIPHHELVELSGRATTMRGLPRIDREVPGDQNLTAEMRNVGRIIRDKKETHINITERGMQKLVKNGNTWEDWVNDRVM